MAPERPIDSEAGRRGGEISGAACMNQEGEYLDDGRPFLTQDEVAVLLRSKDPIPRFDRWRHVPTLELHYYPKGREPENRSDYVRFLP